MKNFGYWLFGADMNKVNLETLHKNGVTDIFLNYYAFTAHGESKVTSWIKKAKNNINVHIWVQCFYDGSWHNPKTTNLNAKLKEIKKYAAIANVKGIHLDYLRYPGTAYKTEGGADAITNFVKTVRKQNPKTFLSCAVMPETECKKYYGQDIDALAKTVDAIIPMQYKGNYKAGTDWLKSTTKFFSAKAKIWSGLQSYKSDDNPTALSANEILTDAKTCLTTGAKGIVLFRYGLSPNVNFTSLQDKATTTTTTKSTGISAANIKTMAVTVKKYVESNKKLPSTVTVGNVKYTWPQVWYILSWHVNNLGRSLSSVPNVKTCVKAVGDSINEEVYPSDFNDQSKRVVQYIKQNGQAPNYVTSVKSKKRVRPRVSIDALARIIVWYYSHNKTLPNYCTYNSGRFKDTSSSSNNTAQSTTNNCENPYTSSPHYLNQGAGALGQITPYDCGPHCIHQGLKKFGVTNISESELMSYCGTTTSGTSHDGLETGIAKAAKKAGIKINVTWKSFSEMGKTDAERFKAIGQLMCKKNVYVFFHLWYSAAGQGIDDDDGCGHYETSDKINIKTGYLRALNSLGSRQGNGYYGHLQDRKFSIQSHYISGISQKSICIMTKG